MYGCHVHDNWAADAGGGLQIFNPWQNAVRALLVDTEIDHVSTAVRERARNQDGGKEDRSRGWPVIQTTKEKTPQQVQAHTKKISIFFGSNASRRTRGAAKQREANRDERAEKMYPRTGKQQPWRRWSRE